MLVGAENGNQVNSFLFNGSLRERRGTQGGRGYRGRHTESLVGTGEVKERQEMGWGWEAGKGASEEQRPSMAWDREEREGIRS